MHRRQFLSGVADIALAKASGQTAATRILDTHIHLFDPTRPRGVPWPPKSDAALYQPALPDRYRKIAAPLGIVGAIEVEASPWLEDNQWVLDVAAQNPIIVGMVGDLEPGKPEFRQQLDRFHRNPLFLGIRYGNLWGRDLASELSNPKFVAGLNALAAAGLELDSANPTPALIAALVRVTDLVPNLRVVIDHLPQLNPPAEPAAQAAYAANLHRLAARPQVYVKISEVLRRVNGRVPDDPAFYRDRLDELWGLFGENRLLYGSDWPNSDHWGSYAQVLGVVRPYFLGKGAQAAAKYFWKNSLAAYRWKPRTPEQKL